MFDDLMQSLRKPKIEKFDWMNDVELILGTDENLNQAIDECINSPHGVYGMDLETTGLDNRVFDGRTKDSIVGIGIAPTVDKAYYFPVGHEVGSEHNISWRRIGEQFGRLLDESVESRPVFHNASFDIEFLCFNGFYDLGNERFDDHKKWEDSYILAYLLNARQKGGRGLKALSKNRLNMEMIELSDLMPDTKDKDYSKLDPSWQPCVLYAGADPLCTLKLYLSLSEEYKSKPQHTSFIYSLEKMCATSVRWMHRCRIYIDRETTLKYVKDGQNDWFNGLLEVYQGASEILGRDIEPTYVKIMKGEIKGTNKFNPNEIGGVEKMNYKIRLEEARKEARKYDASQIKAPQEKIIKSVPKLLGTGNEDVEFPFIYDVNSPQQLGLLFRELKIPNLKASDTGKVVTSKDVLDDIVKTNEDFPFMAKVKTFRELAKALGQYLIPMIEDVAHDGTLKAKFDQFSADTGRFSCKTNSKPHLVKDGGCRVPFQGIPSSYDKNKPECVNSLRKCVAVRDPSNWLVAIDYAGVELRLITNLSREPKWIKEFHRCSDCDKTYPTEIDEQGFPKPAPSICECGSDRIGDLHSLTAIAFYGESARNDKNWKALRQNAKACNFALCYGGTGKAVVRCIEGITDAEGDAKYRTFTKTYNKLSKWWGVQQNTASKNEYVKTAFGRVLDMPDINSDKFRIKSKDQRKSVNSPIQGTSADITKLAMSLIYKGVKTRGWFDKFKMILTVHDEIVFEIHESILKDAIEFVSEVMVRNDAIKRQGWPVALLVDVELGKHWKVPYDLKDLKKGEDEDLPKSLVDIFKDNIIVTTKTYQVEKPVKEEPNVDSFTISELNDSEIKRLGDWLIQRKDKNYKIFFENREVTLLFNNAH